MKYILVWFIFLYFFPTFALIILGVWAIAFIIGILFPLYSLKIFG